VNKPEAGAAKPSKTALVVHFDMGSLTTFQRDLTQKGYVTILARDIPTALLAMTQHYFDIAIVSSKLGEGGDGWPLAGVLHMVFPKAFVAVIAPETSVLTLQSAINNGVSEIYQSSSNPGEIVTSVVAGVSAQASQHPIKKSRIQ
jgi:ActR/RegA family two-component response regulator